MKKMRKEACTVQFCKNERLFTSPLQSPTDHKLATKLEAVLRIKVEILSISPWWAYTRYNSFSQN